MNESGGRSRKEVPSKQPSTASFSKERIMFLRLLRLWCFGFLALSLVASPAFSQGKGKGHNKDGGDDDRGRGKGNKKAKHEFDAQDRELITTYYSNRNSNLPPGLAKRGGNLPPGLEKQLERTGTLPQRSQDLIQPCPVALVPHFPPT